MATKKGEVLVLYGTCPDMESGKGIAKALLDENLVACVNLIPGMLSLYKWQGCLEESGEVAFIGKTSEACWFEASALFSALHPYEEPALVAVNVQNGLEGFVNWIKAETEIDDQP